MNLITANYVPVTPVKPSNLKKLLSEHPDKILVNYLVKGFTFGFSLCYEGFDMDREADNLKISKRQSANTAAEDIKGGEFGSHGRSF